MKRIEMKPAEHQGGHDYRGACSTCGWFGTWLNNYNEAIVTMAHHRCDTEVKK